MSLSGLKSVLRTTLRLSMHNMPRGPHVTRYAMYECLSEWSGTNQGGVGLSIGRSLRLSRLLCAESKIIEANYPEQSWLCLPYRSDSFDFVVSDQVLEHVAGDPQLAVNESMRVVKPGGLVVCTSCMMNEIHKDPVDLWRFTPDGLRFLHRDFGEIIECGGWGSKWVSVLQWLDLRFEPIPITWWHPLHRIVHDNDEARPVVTWLVARK